MARRVIVFYKAAVLLVWLAITVCAMFGYFNEQLDKILG